MSKAEELMSIDFRILEKIRKIKTEVSKERQEKRMQAFVDYDGPKSDTDELDLIDDLQELDWECAIEEEMNRNDRKFAANFGYEMQ